MEHVLRGYRKFEEGSTKNICEWLGWHKQQNRCKKLPPRWDTPHSTAHDPLPLFYLIFPTKFVNSGSNLEVVYGPLYSIESTVNGLIQLNLTDMIFKILYNESTV